VCCPLGDNKNYCGSYQAFLQSYDLSWGRVKSITRSAVGNHEYLTSGRTDCTSANAGMTANRVSDTTWTETGVNFDNAPSFGSALGSSGSFGTNVWISVDVTVHITGNGTYSIGLTTPGSTAISLASRESGSNAPQLIVETTP